MRGRISSVMPPSPLTTRSTPAREARSSSSAAATSSSGSTATGPSETTRPPDSSSERKSTSSISSRADSTSIRARCDELADVLARERRRLEQGEEARERRPQLVRDGGGEARPQLLVGGQVAGLAQVDEPLPARRRRRRGRSAARSRSRRRAALRAPCRPRRCRRYVCRARLLASSTVSRVVEHDDRLPALLDQHPGARRVLIHGAPCNRCPRAGRLAGPTRASGDHFVTIS